MNWDKLNPFQRHKEAHERSDVDSGPRAQHHRLGFGTNQAAPGNLALRRGEATTLTGSGTWIPPAGLKVLRVICIGGGGAGGGADITVAAVCSAGGGGGSGAFTERTLETIPAEVIWSVGVGGIGVSGAIGNPGGTTDFGGLCTAGGGGGGSFSSAGTNVIAQGGTGGVAIAPTDGGLQLAGGGSPGLYGIGIAGNARGGQGARSWLGGGGRASSLNANGGSGSVARGSGGSGGNNSASQATTKAGGDGGQGVIILYYMF